MPAVGLASGVLQRESEDGIALLNGGLALTVVGGQSSVDGVESRGGGELVCNFVASAMSPLLSSMTATTAEGGRGMGGGGVHVPFLKDIVTF